MAVVKSRPDIENYGKCAHPEKKIENLQRTCNAKKRNKSQIEFNADSKSKLVSLFVK